MLPMASPFLRSESVQMTSILMSCPIDNVQPDMRNNMIWKGIIIPEGINMIASYKSFDPEMDVLLSQNCIVDTNQLFYSILQNNNYVMDNPTKIQLSRSQKLYNYINRAITNMYLGKKTAIVALMILHQIIIQSNSKITIPDASTADYDKFYYIWDSQGHYIELEINENQKCYFFYRNKTSEHCWDKEYTFDNEFSEDVMSKLELFYIQ